MESQARLIGTIAFWNDERKFGLIFVTNKRKFFLHLNEFDCDREPQEGEQVSFSVAPAVRGGKHQQAVNATPVVEMPSTQLGGGL